MSGARRALSWQVLVALAATSGGVGFLARSVDALARFRDARAVDAAAPPRVGRLGFEFARLLPPLFAAIPRDAPVLIVTDRVTRLPYLCHAAPRPARVLQFLDDRLPTARGAKAERFEEERRALVDEAERLGRRFTPERYEAELARARFVVVFFGEERRFVTPYPQLEPMAVHAVGGGLVFGAWRVGPR